MHLWLPRPGLRRSRAGRLAARPAEPMLGAPSLSFSSRTRRCAPFLPMPGTCVSAAMSSVATICRRASGRSAASIALCQPRPHSADRLQHLEDGPLVDVGEPVEGQRVLPHDERGVNRRLLAATQTRQRGRRALHGQAEPTDLDDGHVGCDVEHGASD